MSATPVDAYASTATAPASRTAGRRRWPLLLIGASAGTATWSGWVGLGELTGFGVVHPLPGIWDSLTVNTAITLPIGVEAYAVYALAVATDARPLTPLARRWAWASAAGALLLGMGGQIAYHLLEAHQVQTAPWWVVALVSSLPVLVLGAASLLWHLAAVAVPDVAPTSGAVAVPVDVTAVAVDAAAVSAGPAVDAAASTADDRPIEASTAALPGGIGGRLGKQSAALADEAADTPAAASGVSGPVVASEPTVGGVGGPRALPRPTAAATRVPASATGPGRTAKVTATVTTPGDAEILAAAASEPEGPPSIRALMRTYGIGQARATRLHRALRDQPSGDPEQPDDPNAPTSEPQSEPEQTRSEQPDHHDETTD